MPAVDCGLQRHPRLQQVGVALREVSDQPGKTLPELGRVHTGDGACLTLEEVGQLCTDLQSGSIDVHAVSFSRHAIDSSAGFTSLQKMSIVLFASSSVMSPTGNWST